MKGKCYAFSGYKERNNVLLVYLVKTARVKRWLTLFQVEMP